jgi:hypothetical protein
MEPRFVWLTALFGAAMWLALAGALVMCWGLLASGLWSDVEAGLGTLGLSLTAGALTALLALQN